MAGLCVNSLKAANLNCSHSMGEPIAKLGYRIVEPLQLEGTELRYSLLRYLF